MEDGEHRSRSRDGGVSRSPLIFAIFIILSAYIVNVNSLDETLDSIKEESLERHDVSIYVEKKVEFIHSRIPLKHLISSIEHGAKMSNVFSYKVNSTLGRILSSKVKLLISKTDRRLSYMFDKNQKSLTRMERDTYSTDGKRKKRAIEFVGNLISKLFGNPGPEEWRQNTRNMLAMKSAIERQMTNTVILHKDIDQNRHAINAQNEILKIVSKEVVSNSNRLEKVDNALTEFETYLELDMMFNSILEILDLLDKIKEDGRIGRCNENGINQEFLIEHLREIESNKIGIAPIFASWEWHKYYVNNMCSMAIHERDLWITMRIPVVNQAEQLIRVIPMSGQIWIRDTFYKLGLETNLFKFKQSETYMALTKSMLEGCYKLDMFRVCNVRETKFKPSNPYIVPIDIGHGRAVIISNKTETVIEPRAICNGVTKTLKLHRETVLKLPNNCVIVDKAYEVGRNVEEINLSNTVTLNEPEEIVVKKIERKVNRYNPPLEVNSLPKLSNEVELNNNETVKELNSMRFGPFTNTETMLIATSSSSVLLLVSIILLVVVLKCRKYCGVRSSGNNCPQRIIVDLEKNSNKQRLMEELDDFSKNKESDEGINSTDDSIFETPNTDGCRNKCKKEKEIQKPPFQLKH